MEASKGEEKFRLFEMQNGDVTYGKYSPPTEQGESPACHQLEWGPETFFAQRDHPGFWKVKIKETAG